eukprot:97923-Chlamydomonas_euryale.AAC.2
MSKRQGSRGGALTAAPRARAGRGRRRRSGGVTWRCCWRAARAVGGTAPRGQQRAETIAAAGCCCCCRCCLRLLWRRRPPARPIARWRRRKPNRGGGAQASAGRDGFATADQHGEDGRDHSPCLLARVPSCMRECTRAGAVRLLVCSRTGVGFEGTAAPKKAGKQQQDKQASERAS